VPCASTPGTADAVVDDQIDCVLEGEPTVTTSRVITSVMCIEFSRSSFVDSFWD
jgi:hypothetical protein